MALFDVRCHKCRKITEDVVVKFTDTVWNDKGNILKSAKEITDWVCPYCGCKRYKRLPSKIGHVKIT